MKAVTVVFDYDDGKYKKLLRVLKNSWEKNSSIPLEIHPIKPDPKYAENIDHNGLWRNHIKLRKWIDSVDQDTIFLDCDMLCTGDISDGFGKIKHIGITHRDNYKYPINGGVIFVKNTKKAKDFLEKWYEIDEKMLKTPSFHNPYKKKFAGINQASVGWMMKNGYANLITILPCSTYNLCQPWANWQDAKMIHIKSKLRDSCLRKSRPVVNAQTIYEIRKIWDMYVDFDLPDEPKEIVVPRILRRRERRKPQSTLQRLRNKHRNK